MKHTPGEWIISYRWLMDGSRQASSILGFNSTICEGLVWNENREADARLIAAAPDLLEALTMVRDADDDCKADGLPTIPSIARAKIDAAIKKATGE